MTVPSPAAVSADLVVLGAGPAGLATALAAAEAGRSVVVVERSKSVGGMAASFEVAGQRVDLGSHRLHPAAPPEVLALTRRLLGDELQIRPRRGRIRLAGRWVGFPLRAGDLLRSLPPGFAARAAVDALCAPGRRPRHDTYADVIRAGLGRTVSEAFYEPYARKLWGTEPTELSGELARRRVGTRSPAAVLGRVARARRPGGRTFLYPRRGFGQLSEALADSAVAAGADLRLGSAVERVVPAGGASAGSEVVTGDARVVAATVASTLPLATLVGLLVPAPPREVAAAVAGLRMRGMVLVYLVVPRPYYTAFDAHYLPGADTIVSRLSEPKRYRDGDDPAQATVLCAEVPCSEGDSIWTSTDHDLAERVGDELRGQGLPPVDAGHAEVVRLPSVYPVYDLGAADRLAAVEGWVAARTGVVSLGRQGLFAPDNTHHVLAMGTALAACLGPAGAVDPIRWQAARARFRSHVVED